MLCGGVAACHRYSVYTVRCVGRTQHSEKYTHHTYGKSILLTYIYTFIFVIIHFSIKIHFIIDTLPHHRITYNDVVFFYRIL